MVCRVGSIMNCFQPRVVLNKQLLVQHGARRKWKSWRLLPSLKCSSATTCKNTLLTCSPVFIIHPPLGQHGSCSCQTLMYDSILLSRMHFHKDTSYCWRRHLAAFDRSVIKLQNVTIQSEISVLFVNVCIQNWRASIYAVAPLNHQVALKLCIWRLSTSTLKNFKRPFLTVTSVLLVNYFCCSGSETFSGFLLPLLLKSVSAAG